jgi:hypothetical protein
MGFDDQIDQLTVPDTRSPPTGFGFCERCCEEDGTWELGAPGSRPSLLCDTCARLVLGAQINPLEALRHYLLAMPWQERARRALTLGEHVRAETIAIRSEALSEAHRLGLSWSKIGDAISVSEARAANIASGRDRRRREIARRTRQFHE